MYMHPAKPEKYMYEPILTRTFLSWCVHTRGFKTVVVSSQTDQPKRLVV